MKQHLALTTVLINEYQAAIDFYVNTLGFNLIEDTPIPDANDVNHKKRWVVVAPPGSNESALLLAEPANKTQAQYVGNQTGGRVFLFLYTDDFWRDYERYRERGVEFVREEPRKEAYGTVAVFKDIAGNLWDLIEPSN